MYYTLNSLSLFWLAKNVLWIFEFSVCDVLSADYTIILLRSRVVVVCALCVASRQWRSQNMTSIFFFQCIIKQLLLDSVSVTSGIIKVSVRLTHTSTLIILDITKTSTSKCFTVWMEVWIKADIVTILMEAINVLVQFVIELYKVLFCFIALTLRSRRAD